MPHGDGYSDDQITHGGALEMTIGLSGPWATKPPAKVMSVATTSKMPVDGAPDPDNIHELPMPLPCLLNSPLEVSPVAR